MFVVPASGAEDYAYIIIDSARTGKAKFFKLAHLHKKPTIENMETEFERPMNINLNSYKNGLVGFME